MDLRATSCHLPLPTTTIKDGDTPSSKGTKWPVKDITCGETIPDPQEHFHVLACMVQYAAILVEAQFYPTDALTNALEELLAAIHALDTEEATSEEEDMDVEELTKTPKAKTSQE